MNFGKYIFSQIADFLPNRYFETLVVLNGRMAEKNFYSSCPISIPVLVATSTSGRSDKIKDKALSKFFCNFELLFEWERCLVGYC